MSQGALQISTVPPLPGATLVGVLNTALAALASSSSGSSVPTLGPGVGGALVEGQPWVDTSTTPHTVREYDGANWVAIGFLDASNHVWQSLINGTPSTLASASTVDLGSVASCAIVVSGTATITSFGSNAALQSGQIKFVRFSGALTLTYNATSLITPTAASITTVAGDAALLQYLGSGNWRVLAYWPGSVSVLVSSVAGRTGAVTLTSSDLTDSTTTGRALVGAASAAAGRSTLSAAASGANSDITSLSGLTTALTAAQGGTGQASYAIGDVLYASGTTALSKLAGNTTTTKKFLRQTGSGSASAAPAWDTVVAADVPAAALTKTDDTNVTLTLGGTPASALLAAASITVGWTGTLSVARGGIGTGTAGGTALDNITGFSSTGFLQRTGAGTYSFVALGTIATQAASAVAITGGTIDGTAIGATTPATAKFTTLSLARAAVANTAYSVAAGISIVAYTSISAARVVTLPAASSFAAGQRLLIVDESGSCSVTNTITPTRAGSDTVNGATTVVLSSAYAAVELESNGSSTWTVVGQPGGTGGGGGSGTVSSGTANQLAYYAGTGTTVSGLTSANNGILATSGAGVPSIATAVPSGVTATTQAIGDSSTKLATTEFVGQNHLGGFTNKIRNGTFDIWQRGTASITVTTAGAYAGADGWIILPTGASVTTIQAANGRTGARTRYVLQVTGATSATDVIVKQRIESFLAAQLAGQTVTFQAQITNNTGGSITPTLIAKHPTTTADVFSSLTAESANGSSLQACANGATTLVAYTLALSTGAALGLEIGLDFGSNFSTTGKSIQITEVDLRATQGVATGLNALPPPPELRTVQAELALCQRYLVAYNSVALGFAVGTTVFGTIYLPVTMRANPSSSVTSMTASAGANGTFAEAAINQFVWMPYNSSANWTVTATITFTATLSAEL